MGHIQIKTCLQHPAQSLSLTLQILLFTSQQYFIIYQIQVILRIFISFSFNLIDFLFHHNQNRELLYSSFRNPQNIDEVSMFYVYLIFFHLKCQNSLIRNKKNNAQTKNICHRFNINFDKNKCITIFQYFLFCSVKTLMAHSAEKLN